MKLVLDPIAPLRDRAERIINEHFNRAAAGFVQRDHEHARKREIAGRVAEAGAKAAPEAFLAEASASGKSPESFAALILSKPDEVLERGLARRKAILAVRRLTSEAAIDAVMDELGIEREQT